MQKIYVNLPVGGFNKADAEKSSVGYDVIKTEMLSETQDL